MTRGRWFNALTVGLVCVASNQLLAQPRIPDHLDGIADDTVLFYASPRVPGRLGIWYLSYTQLPPALNFYDAPDDNPYDASIFGTGCNPWPPPENLQEPTAGHWDGFNDARMDPTANRTFVADVNGDGVSDLVIEGFRYPDEPWAPFWQARITPVHNGLGMLAPDCAPLTTWWGSTNGDPGSNSVLTLFGYFMADVNGDGRADRLTVRDSNGADPGGDMFWEAFYTPAAGTCDQPNNEWNCPITVGSMAWGEVWYDSAINPGTQSLVRPIVGDFNGDGRADVGRRYPSDATVASGWVAIYPTGPEGLAGPTSVIQGNVSNWVENNVPANVATLVGDLNGDGTDDIIEIEDRAHDGNFLFVIGLTLPCSPGGTDLCINPWYDTEPHQPGMSWAAPFGTPDAGFLVNTPLLADLNGDGRDDLVVYREYPDPGNPDNYIMGQWLVSFVPEGGSLDGLVTSQVGTYFYPREYAEQMRPMKGQFTQCPLIPCCPVPFADADRDKDVDLDDFGKFQACFTGPGVEVTPDCNCFDHDGNLHVDANDVAAFLNCASGPTVKADPACAP